MRPSIVHSSAVLLLISLSGCSLGKNRQLEIPLDESCPTTLGIELQRLDEEMGRRLGQIASAPDPTHVNHAVTRFLENRMTQGPHPDAWCQVKIALYSNPNIRVEVHEIWSWWNRDLVFASNCSESAIQDARRQIANLLLFAESRGDFERATSFRRQREQLETIRGYIIQHSLCMARHPPN